MAQAVLIRVLQDINSLELSELGSVERALKERLETAGYSPEEWTAMQGLVASGLMKDIKPRYNQSVLEHTPISIQGKPLSETILEERR